MMYLFDSKCLNIFSLKKSKISTCTFSCLSTNFKKVHQCFCKSSILPSIIELFFFYDAPLRWSFNYAKISKLTSVPSSGGSHCKSGAMHCLMNSFKSYSRSMDELAYQLNLSDTLDWSYDDDEDETNSTLGKRIAFYEKWYFCKEKFIKPFSFLLSFQAI